MLVKKLQPVQITDKTCVFFQYSVDSGFVSGFALQDRSLEFIKNSWRFLFPFFDNWFFCKFLLTDDMNTLPAYDSLKKTEGLYRNVKLDESRTCVYWNDRIDLPSDTIYEHGKRLA